MESTLKVAKELTENQDIKINGTSKGYVADKIDRHFIISPTTINKFL